MNDPSATHLIYTMVASGGERWKILYGDQLAVAADQRPLSDLTYEEARELMRALNAALVEFAGNKLGNNRN